MVVTPDALRECDYIPVNRGREESRAVEVPKEEVYAGV